MSVPRWVWVAGGLSLGAVAVAVQERAAAPGGGGPPLGERFAAFVAEVQAGMAEREAELRDALGLDGRHDAVDAHTLAPAGGGPAVVPATADLLAPSAPTEPPPAAPAALEPAAPAHPPALPLPRTPEPDES